LASGTPGLPPSTTDPPGPPALSCAGRLIRASAAQFGPPRRTAPGRGTSNRAIGAARCGTGLAAAVALAVPRLTAAQLATTSAAKTRCRASIQNERDMCFIVPPPAVPPVFAG